MAVLVQFTTLLIRIDRLTAVAPDGVAAVERRWGPSWRDRHLFAIAFMDMGARELAAELEQMGLTLRDTSSGTRMWQDICVIDYYDGPTLPCPWLEYDPARHVAWLKGTAPGEVAGPEHRHEEAPIRIPREKFQQLVQQQQQQQQGRSRAPTPSHEDALLPLTRAIAEELLSSLPTGLELAALIFMAQFPARGRFVAAGVVIHDLDGEPRQITLPPLTERTRELLRTLSEYESGTRLTSIEIKIAADGATTTNFGIAPPLTEEQLKAQLQRQYGSVPEGSARTPPPAGGVRGLLRALGFGPKREPSPRLTLTHVPQREPLSIFLDEFRGIDEGWTDLPAGPPAPVAAPSARPVFDLSQFHALEGQRAGTGPAPVAVAAGPGARLAVPDQAGVLTGEARELRPGTLADLHRARPTLRFDPIAGTLRRELGPELGALDFRAWKGDLRGFGLRAEGLPGFDALMARLRPVLVALGGMGPIVDARGAQRPSGLREHRPVTIDELRDYLVADSPYGTKVFPCFLLGGPPHVVVKLELGVEIEGGRPVYCYAVDVELP